MFHKPKKKGRIYGFRSFTHGKGARQRQRNDRTYRAFHHTEERRPHTHAPKPQAHRIPRRGERPFGGYTAEIGRSGADTQNQKQPSTGNSHQRVGNARGHEADRRRKFRRKKDEFMKKLKYLQGNKIEVLSCNHNKVRDIRMLHCRLFVLLCPHLHLNINLI